LSPLRWLWRVLAGPAVELEQQLNAQGVELLDFPAEVVLGDERLTLRLITRDDADRILRFARALPDHDLLFLRRNITEEAGVERWMGDIEEGLSMAVAAFREDSMEGYAAVARERIEWTRHVAELRVLTSEWARGRGLGRLLTEQAFAIAKSQGIRKMIAQMTTDQTAATAIFKHMGFVTEAELKKHVQGRDGELYDLQIMSLDVEAFAARVDLARLTAEVQRGDIPG
jgi:L-amino acid N-acyltransferase YncA